MRVGLCADARRGVTTRHAAAHDGLGALIKPRAARSASTASNWPTGRSVTHFRPAPRLLRGERSGSAAERLDQSARAEMSGRDRHRASRCMRWPDPVAVPTRHPATGGVGRLVGPAESLAFIDCSTTATVRRNPSRAARRPASRCRRRQRRWTYTSVERSETDVAVAAAFRDDYLQQVSGAVRPVRRGVDREGDRPGRDPEPGTRAAGGNRTAGVQHGGKVCIASRYVLTRPADGRRRGGWRRAIRSRRGEP